MTERMMIDAADPEVAAILQGRMSGETEIAVLGGKLSETAPKVVTEAEQRQAAVDAWIAAHPPTDPAELERQVRERQMVNEASRRESAMIAATRAAAANRSLRGW